MDNTLHTAWNENVYAGFNTGALPINNIFNVIGFPSSFKKTTRKQEGERVLETQDWVVGSKSGVKSRL